MNYQIIARKYRPKNFSEVIGQEKIVTILQNALKKNRIGQAYLFSGPRGVGKTTSARILVKYLNCESTGEVIPCNQCPSCQEINRGVSLDYLEIDGASNRGIDQIRALNEQLTFASPTGKYRVFVIDEVHMLTNEAFNALLKSLEEPPDKIIFVLCTTESYRIPLTIRSRCQQLFFSNVDFRLIEKHLEFILKTENISFAPNSLWDLAKKSEGSIRDAENLLEKVIAFNDDKKITTALVQEVLGEAPADKKYRFLIHLNEENLKANLELVNQLSSDGYNLNEFFYNLIDVLSNLVYYKSEVQDPDILSLSEEEMKQLKGCEKLFTLTEIFTLVDILFEFIHTLKTTTHGSTMVQYLIIKLHRYRHLITPSELKENILHLSRYTLPDPSLDIPKPTPDPTSSESEKPIAFHISPSTNPAPVDPQPELKKSMSSETRPVKSEKMRDQEKPAPAMEPVIAGVSPVEEQRSLSPKIWTEADYRLFLQIIKESDLGLFRLAAAFPFQKMEGENLILENRNDLISERVEGFKEQMETYINQSAASHPQLTELIAGRHFKIIVLENIVKSNLEKIKKVFPLNE